VAKILCSEVFVDGIALYPLLGGSVAWFKLSEHNDNVLCNENRFLATQQSFYDP
jgi:uncharacterized protein (AIM24 family)